MLFRNDIKSVRKSNMRMITPLKRIDNEQSNEKQEHKKEPEQPSDTVELSQAIIEKTKSETEITSETNTPDQSLDDIGNKIDVVIK